MDNQALKVAQEWANNEYLDLEDRQYIQKLIDEDNQIEITESFYKDLAFGTGGMRSILGLGTNRMNKYNIRKATQALCLEVISANQNKSDLKMAISYDSRKFSFEFAKEAAGVVAANGIKAYIYNRLNPVPMLSWAVRHKGAQAGVMVTASHNPPEYNGYKVYWSDGAQVTPPNDERIINNFYGITSFDQVKSMDFDQALSEGKIEWMGEDVEEAYYQAVLASTVRPELCRESGDELKVVYTPIHGTGLLPCTTVLNRMGFNNVIVPPEQEKPDSAFPTVTSPNPENPSALKMAVDLMEEKDFDIVMGSDPDTDRLGLAIKHDGEIVYLNGNQIGVLKLHYVLNGLKETGRLKDNSYFVKTIVTSRLQDKIAENFGVEVFNTLTGFKWICGQMKAIEETNPEKNFVFATEESFGYLSHENVRDKDGVSSVTLMAEVALFYKKQGKNLVEALDAIYEEYGFSHEELLNLVYEGKSGAEKIGRIMETFRSMESTELFGQELKLTYDYQSQVEKDLSTGETVKLDLPISNVLGYAFTNGNYLFLRPSGTEPKIKFYIMIQENEGTLEEKKKKATAVTDDFLAKIKAVADKA